MRRLPVVALTALSILVSAPFDDATATELQPLSIFTKSRKADFMVEVARTERDRALGLMFRRELPPGSGMLFIFVPARSVAFWMKNTYVSLDIIFINADGRIRKIAPNATPLSQRQIASGGPVRAVLEVLAGTAAELGISPGDQVEHPLVVRRRPPA